MVEIRFVEPAEMGEFADAISFGFGQDPSTDEARLDRWLAINPAETSIMALDRGKIVATFGSYNLDMTVPGGASAPTAGTTHVTVHPTHRRQGILSKMMRLHLDQATEMGKPMASLWSSDERIYGRFGYGPAAFGHDLSIPARTVELPPPDPGLSVHALSLDEARVSLPAIYEHQVGGVAGRIARSQPWWEARFFQAKSPRSPAGASRHVIVERDGVEVGYVIFRLRTPENFSEGRTVIEELIAFDDPARRALWNFALNVDLFRNVSWANAPVDDPLFFELDRFRSVQRLLIDSAWVRPLDVPSLLSTRGYERDGSIVIGVVDDFGPTTGRYRITVADGVGVCEPTTDTADAELQVEDLGRLTLGGGSAYALHRAGLVDGSPKGVGQLDDLLATRLQPHCPEVF